MSGAWWVKCLSCGERVRSDSAETVSTTTTSWGRASRCGPCSDAARTRLAEQASERKRDEAVADLAALRARVREYANGLNAGLPRDADSVLVRHVVAELRALTGEGPAGAGTDEREAFVYTVDLATGEFGTRPVAGAGTEPDTELRDDLVGEAPWIDGNGVYSDWQSAPRGAAEGPQPDPPRDRRHAIIAGGITVAVVPCTDECDHGDRPPTTENGDPRG